MFKKILIANRGEIALRVIRTAREMGIKTVVVYSTADEKSLPVLLADESVCVGRPPRPRGVRQVLCIIEAMKLMNEIEAETGGVVREILVKNAEPVEYGQTLFLIE